MQLCYISKESRRQRPQALIRERCIRRIHLVYVGFLSALVVTGKNCPLAMGAILKNWSSFKKFGSAQKSHLKCLKTHSDHIKLPKQWKMHSIQDSEITVFLKIVVKTEDRKYL